MLNFSQIDREWMHLAIECAQKSAQQGEVPVGAVVVENNHLIAATHNQPISLNDPTAHAEILALRAAGAKFNNYRLNTCSLYVTLEPCPMCLGAIAQARLKRVVFAAVDKKLGACGGAFDLHLDKQINPHTEIVGGIMANESKELLQNFFKLKRKNNKLRLQCIAKLENIPNVNLALLKLLNENNIYCPQDLIVYQNKIGLEKMLSWASNHIEMQARITALHQFMTGNLVNSWKNI